MVLLVIFYLFGARCDPNPVAIILAKTHVGPTIKYKLSLMVSRFVSLVWGILACFWPFFGAFGLIDKSTSDGPTKVQTEDSS